MSLMTARIAMKNVNPGRLHEEIVAAGLGGLVMSVSWAGFDRVSRRAYSPKAARALVGVSVVNGARQEDHAEPGELRFAIARALTASEGASLDSVLSSHVATVLSVEQVREDQDAVDLQYLRDRYDEWGVLTALSKDEVQRRLLRVLLRNARGDGV